MLSGSSFRDMATRPKALVCRMFSARLRKPHGNVGSNLLATCRQMMLPECPWVRMRFRSRFWMFLLLQRPENFSGE